MSKLKEMPLSDLAIKHIRIRSDKKVRYETRKRVCGMIKDEAKTREEFKKRQ